MKREMSKRAKRLGIIIAVTFAVAFCLLQIAGAIFDVPAISVFAGVSHADKFDTRNRLLTQAMAYVGVDDPEETAKVWAQGVKLKNAAMQYAMMNSELRESYAARLDKNAPDWVTGASGSELSGFSITKVEKQGNSSAVTLTFTTAVTKSTAAQTFTAKLTIEPEGDFYRIASIEADAGLGPYTGL